MERTLTWTIYTLAEIADSLDAINLNELIQDLKHDPITIIEAVTVKLEAELEKRVDDEALCPKCFAKTQTTYKASYIDGYVYREPTGSTCPECGRKGDVQ
jgi:hypothetical protein